MYHNQNLTFSASTNSSLQPKENPEVPYVIVETPWTQALGISKAYLFGLISALSVKHNYCYASDHFLAQHLGLEERQVRRYIKELENRKWIYRNTYPTPIGKMRHIIPKNKYKDYWDSHLNRKKVPEEAKKRFLAATFEAPPPTDKNVRCIGSKKSSQRTKMSVAYSSDRSVPSSSSEGPRRQIIYTAYKDAAAFVHKLEKELRKAGFEKKVIEKVKGYAKRNPHIPKKVKNPVGWYIQGLRKGWLLEKLEEPTMEEKKQSDIELNRHLAKRIAVLKGKEAADKRIQIEVLHKSIEFVFVGAQCEPLAVEYSDPLFSVKVGKVLEKCQLKDDDVFLDSRETNPMEESRQKRKNLL